MTELRKVGDLQIAEDVEFQRKEWRFERVGWALMALALLAALLGLLGPGPLSSATAGEEDGAFWVDYERFAHRSALTTLEVHAGPETVREGQLRLWLGREFLAANQVRSIQPEPEQVSTAGDRVVYTFAVDDPARGVNVFFHLEPTQYWRQGIVLGVEGGPEVGFTQVIYPLKGAEESHMEAVIRGLAVYIFLLVALRATGKRTMAQTTTFDFVLLLIISETIQQALLDSDNSLTHGFLLVVTLLGTSVALSFVKEYLPWAEKAIDSTPLIVIDDGQLLRERMKKLRVDESDILESARENYGLERLDQIKYAIVERTGTISIVSREGG